MDRESEQFCRLAGAGDDAASLAEAALVIGRDVYPDLDVAAELTHLHELGAKLRARLPEDLVITARLHALNRYLFDELGFRGNDDAYYDPRNSYLNELLARRLGIPITLAIVYLCVGQTIGLKLRGVSFPGHFLVSLSCPDGLVVLDPFAAGRSHSEASLREKLSQVAGETDAAVLPLGGFLEPSDNRQIALRMLRNLKSIYQKRGEHDKTLLVLQRMLLLAPEIAAEWRARAEAYHKLECFRAALNDYQHYLSLEPEAPDRREVEALVLQLRESCAKIN
jgi:regulator of sirC expression with transglutaminase-like and TPR domain